MANENTLVAKISSPTGALGPSLLGGSRRSVTAHANPECGAAR